MWVIIILVGVLSILNYQFVWRDRRRRWPAVFWGGISAALLVALALYATRHGGGPWLSHFPLSLYGRDVVINGQMWRVGGVNAKAVAINGLCYWLELSLLWRFVAN